MTRRVLPPSETFTTHGRRIAYRTFGEGPRVVVLTHGLLMDARMYTALAPTLATHGYRVITVDMLGHGASDQPHDMTAYSMPRLSAWTSDDVQGARSTTSCPPGAARRDPS